jgi:hypothetical protein
MSRTPIQAPKCKRLSKRGIDVEKIRHTIFKLTTYNGGASKNATPFNSVPVHLCKIILGPEAINRWP